MSNKQLILIVGGVFLLILLAITLFSGIFFKRSNGPNSSSQNPFNFGTGTTTVITPGNVDQSGKLPLVLNNGSVAYTNDFTKVDQPAWASDQAGYQVAGSATSNFLVTYILPDPQTHRAQFLMTILSEPLGETRRAAEQAFRETLGLTNAELCALNVDVRVGPGVNDAYLGQSLGMSFCPGAVPLP